MLVAICLLITCVSIALFFVRGKGWRRALRVIGATVSSLIEIFASALLLFLWSCTPPSVEVLHRRFPKQRRDLETILAMSDEDKHMTRIDPDWLMNDKPAQFLEYDPSAGISLERWNQYRKLFAKNNITQGIQRSQKNGDAFIMVKSEALLNRGISNGYIHCGAQPAHIYELCKDSRSRGEHFLDRSKKEGDEGYSFIRLDGGWYAVSLGPS